MDRCHCAATGTGAGVHPPFPPHPSGPSRNENNESCPLMCVLTPFVRPEKGPTAQTCGVRAEVGVYLLTTRSAWEMSEGLKGKPTPAL